MSTQSDEEIRALTIAFELERAKNEILHVIDDACDPKDTPSGMYQAIAEALQKYFSAVYCGFFVANRESGELEFAIGAFGDSSFNEGSLLYRTIRNWVMELDGAKEEPQETVLAKPSGNSDLYCIAINIILRGKRLGAVVLSDPGSPFKIWPDENSPVPILLKEAESVMDTVLGRALIIHSNEQLLKIQKSIYQADALRDNEFLTFDEMLEEAVKLLAGNVDAESGFLMLFDTAQKEMALMNTMGIDGWGEDRRDIITSVAEDAIEKGKTILEHCLMGSVESVICIPLLLRGNIIGVFGAINPNSKERFDRDDQELLDGIASQIDTAIFESRRSKKYERILSRSVGPDMIGPLLDSADEGLLAAKWRESSIVFVDIRGFTDLTEKTEEAASPELIAFLNAFYTEMVAAIYAHGGMVDNFVGDEVIGTFNTITDQPDHATRALRTAIDMQKRYTEMLKSWEERGFTVQIGVGVTTGKVIVGEMGTPDRSKFTFVGKSGNLAARLCTCAKGGEIIISSATYAELTESFELEAIDADCKGIGIVPAYKVSVPS